MEVSQKHPALKSRKPYENLNLVKIIFRTFIFRFHVDFRGCIWNHPDFLLVGIHHPGEGKVSCQVLPGSKGVEITWFFKGWKIPSISTRRSVFFHLTTTKNGRFSMTGWISEPSDPMFFDTIYANSGEYLDDLCQFCLCQPRFRTARATNEFDV